MTKIRMTKIRMTKISYTEAQDLFRSFLDDMNKPAVILGYAYPASTVLEEVDPIAFRTSLHDWADSMGYEIVEG